MEIFWKKYLHLVLDVSGILLENYHIFSLDIDGILLEKTHI